MVARAMGDDGNVGIGRGDGMYMNMHIYIGRITDTVLYSCILGTHNTYITVSPSPNQPVALRSCGRVNSYDTVRSDDLVRYGRSRSSVPSRSPPACCLEYILYLARTYLLPPQLHLHSYITLTHIL